MSVIVFEGDRGSTQKWFGFKVCGWRVHRNPCPFLRIVLTGKDTHPCLRISWEQNWTILWFYLCYMYLSITCYMWVPSLYDRLYFSSYSSRTNSLTLSLISSLFSYLTKKVIYGTLNSNVPAMYPKILEAQSPDIASKIYGT